MAVGEGTDAVMVVLLDEWTGGGRCAPGQGAGA